MASRAWSRASATEGLGRAAGADRQRRNTSRPKTMFRVQEAAGKRDERATHVAAALAVARVHVFALLLVAYDFLVLEVVAAVVRWVERI